MCGITGYFSKERTERSLINPLSVIEHRGPDGEGIYHHNHIGLGHKRLSIIDLSDKANQPFHSSCGRYTILFNGEIYNYENLKNDLKESVFATTSDTEVLLNLYIKKGRDCLNHLRGMFALVIYDSLENKLFCARDQLGIKPLYYYHTNEVFLFGSELKSIFAFDNVEKRINNDSILEFLLNGFLYEPDTGYDNVYKLRPGHFAEVSLENGRVVMETSEYWNVSNTVSPKETLNELIKCSIDDHLVSDVPVGLFFSGGVDSSIILNQVKDTVQSYVVKSSQDEIKEAGIGNDYEYAQKVAHNFGVGLIDLSLSNHVSDGEEFLDSIVALSLKSEELIADYTFISSELISKAARDNSYKVMLSGLGADELFAGYPRYTLVKYERIFKLLKSVINLLFSNKSSFSKKIERFNNFLKGESFHMKYTSLVGVFDKDEILSNLKTESSLSVYELKMKRFLDRVKSYSNLKKAMYLDLYGFLSHNFLVADKSSMQASIEMRVPLATKELAQYAFNQSDGALISFRETKKLLKRHLRLFLPRSIVNRKKVGFNPPLDHLINSLSPNRIYEFCEDYKLFDVLEKKYVEGLVDDHFSNKSNNTYKIYTLLYLSAWLGNNKN